MNDLRRAALAFGKVVTDKQFAGRKGHGGNPELAERHLKREQMQILLAAAFEAGATLGNQKLVTFVRGVYGPQAMEAQALLRELGDEPAARALVASIRPGDRVTIRTPRGQERMGVAVICSGTHVALNMGGQHGTPGVATPENLVSIRRAK